MAQIATLLGGAAAAKDQLSKCVFTVGIGSNDYINNYFLPNLYPTSKEFTPEQYAKALIAQYSLQLKVGYIFLSFSLFLIITLMHSMFVNA